MLSFRRTVWAIAHTGSAIHRSNPARTHAHAATVAFLLARGLLQGLRMKGERDMKNSKFKSIKIQVQSSMYYA